MASAKQKLNDDISCTIYTDQRRNSSTLGCGHTFCRRCLDEFTKTQPDAIKAKSLLCPQCKQMTKVPNPSSEVEDWVLQFKQSFLVHGLTHYFAPHETHNPDKNPCLTCLQYDERVLASSYCADCKINICDTCIKAHDAIPATTNHVLVALSEKLKMKQKKNGLICKVHNTIAEFCCNDCRKAACYKCCSLDHSKCDNVDTIESLMPKMRSFLKVKRELFSQQMVQNMTSTQFI